MSTQVQNVSSPNDPNPFGNDIQEAAKSGEAIAAAAFLENCNAVQGYSTALMGLSQAIEQQAQTLANYWINTVMDAPYDPTKGHDDQSDMGKIAWDKANGGQNGNPDVSTLLQEDSPVFTEHNTEYNQSSSFFSGVDNGVNQNSSDTTQTIQLMLTMYQSGPLSQQQTLTQAL